MGDARLDAIARGCRVQIIRMLAHAGSGHPGGSLIQLDDVVSKVLDRRRSRMEGPPAT